MKNRKSIIIAVILLVGLVFAFSSPVLSADPEPSGTIDIKKWKAGFILGIGGGGGTLKYQGKSYPIKIGGLRVGAIVGVAHADLTGTVYNMKQLSDIEGTYLAGEAAIAVGGGGKVSVLENNKGVVLKLKGMQVGIEIAIDVGGMSIKLKK